MKQNSSPPAGAPTMIIPNGTKIEVDGHGQLSIRTPGNLVLQNSGSYGTIESATGSIRIEPNVQVEAVNIQCAEICYIQGSLTAWKVKARAIELEESARAHIILQETERLQIGREARLVGNFASEKELFLLLSRFARQLKSMPFYQERRPLASGEDLLPESSVLAAAPPRLKAAEAAPARGSGETAELPDPLFFALVLLERESGRSGNGPTSQRSVEELVKLLRRRDTVKLRETYGGLFDRIVEPSDDIQRARELVQGFYEGVTA